MLLDRAERQLERTSRRIDTLKARCELQQGRLSQGAMAREEEERTTTTTAAGVAEAPTTTTGTRLVGAEARLRANTMRRRKEALKYGVERLELEVLQKERELRKRLENA